MPIGDYDPMYAVNQNLTATYMQKMMEQKMEAIKYRYAKQQAVQTDTRQQETLEWAKFAMWLRGFLNAVEGKELTKEDVDKVMEKLATVDPESQGWRYEDQPNQYIPQPQPYNPHPGIGSPVWPPNTGGTGGQWTYRDSVTSDGTSLEKLKAYLSSSTGEVPDAK